MIAKTRRSAKFRHAGIRQRALCELTPSPENDWIYKPADDGDPALIELAGGIQAHGVKVPLVVTTDNYILSGHRRYAAARLARVATVPCYTEAISRCEEYNRFLVLLREYNRQRVKSYDEVLREEALDTNPAEAFQSLIEHRQRQAGPPLDSIYLREKKDRPKISPAKSDMLAAMLRIIESLRKYWPVSVRQIHYGLLDPAPLRHVSKPDSRYRNDNKAYNDATDLATRARLEGLIPMHVIEDETRPVCLWGLHDNVQPYLHSELDDFLKGYFRNLLQSQPDHIELIIEKNTLGGIIRPVAMEYCIPTTSGRGFCSLPPRYQISERFRKSGKDRLVLLLLTDFDPSGEEIAHSAARSMRDDFGIDKIEAIKVALTADQVAELNLPTGQPVKGDKDKPNSIAGKFRKRHGNYSYELEAVPPATLQKILRDAIDSVIDVDLFNRELEAEKADAASLDKTRRAVHRQLAGMLDQEQDAGGDQ